MREGEACGTMPSCEKSKTCFRSLGHEGDCLDLTDMIIPRDPKLDAPLEFKPITVVHHG